MTVKIQAHPSGPGMWAFVSAADTTELGAYLPGDDDELHGTLTVFWRGIVDRALLPGFVTQAGEMLSTAKFEAKGTIVAFGPSRAAETAGYGNVAGLLEKSSKFFGYDAYRIKLDAPPHQWILWTTFKGSSRSLAEGGENIGICVSRPLFDGLARPGITRVIEETRPDNSKLNVSMLMDEISKDFLSRFPPNQRRLT